MSSNIKRNMQLVSNLQESIPYILQIYTHKWLTKTSNQQLTYLWLPFFKPVFKVFK